MMKLLILIGISILMPTILIAGAKGLARDKNKGNGPFLKIAFIGGVIVLGAGILGVAGALNFMLGL